MIGRFANFPSEVHGTAKICNIFASNLKIHSFVLRALSNLNYAKETDVFEFFDEESSTMISFEVGLADGAFFNYLNQENLAYELHLLSSNSPLDVLDFLIIVKYHKVKGERSVPLRFDTFLLRFKFSAKALDLLVFQIRGSRRIQIRDLLEYIIGKINEDVEKKGFKPLIIEKIDAL
jgi:hypothetical protein